MRASHSNDAGVLVADPSPVTGEAAPRFYREACLLGLAAIVVATVTIRFVRLDGVGLWLDEILAVLRSQTSPWTTSWTPGADPQHGVLYHLLLALVGTISTSDTAYRAPFAVAGVLAVPLLYVVARQLAGPPVALLAAGLLAAAPLHVFHSQDARPYTLLVLEQLVGLLAVLKLLEQPGSALWSRVLVGVIVLLLGSSLQGFWYGLGLLAACTWATLARWQVVGTRRALLRLGGISLTIAVLVPALYGPLLVKHFDPLSPPPLSLDFVSRFFQPVVSGFNEHNPSTWVIGPVLALAAIGSVALIRRRPAAGLIVTSTFVLGFVLPLVALYARTHGVYARFALAALAPLLILCAAGLMALAEPLCRALAFLVSRMATRSGHDDPRVNAATPAAASSGAAAATAWLALAASAAFVVLAWRAQQPTIHEAFGSRANWRGVARLIADRAQPGDRVVATNEWPRVSLAYYLPRFGAKVDLVSAGESVERAMTLARERGVAFVVTGGWHATPFAREWVKQLPEIYTSRNEGMILAFYPDRTSYMTMRPPRTELVRDERWLWTSLDGTFIPGSNGSKFLLEGWGGLEAGPDGQQFRWIEGRRAALYLPLVERRPRHLTFEARAFGPVASEQRLVVAANGVPVFSTPLDGAWRPFAIDLGPAAWRDGANQLTLDLSAAARPSDVAPGSTDGRHLSASVRVLRVR